jgi:hypothetical protein
VQAATDEQKAIQFKRQEVLTADERLAAALASRRARLLGLLGASGTTRYCVSVSPWWWYCRAVASGRASCRAPLAGPAGWPLYPPWVPSDCPSVASLTAQAASCRLHGTDSTALLWYTRALRSHDCARAFPRPLHRGPSRRRLARSCTDYLTH